jgi:hypothetical protein
MLPAIRPRTRSLTSLAIAGVALIAVVVAGAGIARRSACSATEDGRLATRRAPVAAQAPSIVPEYHCTYPADPATPAPPRPTTDVPSPPPSWAGHVRRIDDVTYQVDRAWLRNVPYCHDCFSRVRIIPFIGDGKPQGFKLYAIAPGTLPAALGFHNGDAIVAANGVELDRPDGLLELYAHLDRVSALVITGMRGGKPLAITWRLR